jgi:Ca-activated chloride channel family protein
MNLTFAHPSFFWLLLVLPLLALLKVAADRRSKALLQRAVAARLVPRLVTPHRPWRGWTALALEMMAMALLITTMARPQMGFVEEEVLTSGRSILFALDTSRSMLANDLEPDRLTRTKLVITDLIAKLKTDRIGLIAFAGKPFLQAPITQDHAALLETLDQCDTDIIPRGGSNLAEAITLAVESFKGKNLPPGKTVADLSSEELLLIEKAQATSQALIIFSDGEQLEGEALAAAKQAADANVTIITVGVGTKQGGIIPSPESKGRDYIRDEQGKLVKSVLQQEVLEEVARATRGLYLPLTEVLSDNRLNLILSKLDSGSNKNKTLKKAVERYHWPLVGSLLFLLAGVGVRILRSRPRKDLGNSLVGASGVRGIATAIVLLLSLTLSNAPAAKLPGGPEDAPKEKLHNPAPYEQRLQELTTTWGGGNDHLSWKRLGEGSVAYANGEYDLAVEKFGKALLGQDPKLRSQAHFNLANTIVQRAKLATEGVKKFDSKLLGEIITKLEDSISQYQETLTLEPKHTEASDNKRKIEEFIKELQKQKEAAEKQEGKKDEKKDGEKKEGEQEGEDKKDKGKEEEGKKDGDKEGKGEKEGEGKDGKDGEPKDKDGKEGEKKEGQGAGDEKKEDEKSGQQGKEDKRSEEQKAKDKAALEESNREFKKTEKKDKPGEKPGDKPSEQMAAEMKKNQRTGFSRVEARRNLDRFSDTVEVRPQMEEARPDRPFKNW